MQYFSRQYKEFASPCNIQNWVNNDWISTVICFPETFLDLFTASRLQWESRGWLFYLETFYITRSFRIWIAASVVLNEISMKIEGTVIISIYKCQNPLTHSLFVVQFETSTSYFTAGGNLRWIWMGFIVGWMYFCHFLRLTIPQILSLIEIPIKNGDVVRNFFPEQIDHSLLITKFQKPLNGLQWNLAHSFY